MGFVLFLLYLVLSFIRPAELDPTLGPFQIMTIASIAALAGALFEVLRGNGPSFRAPQIYLACLFVLWAAFSVFAATRWMGGALSVFASFRASGVIFLLAILNINSLRRFRITTGVLTVLAVILVGQSLFSYHTGWRADVFQVREILNSEGELEEVGEEHVPDERPEGTGLPADAPGIVVRIRSLGSLNDPNDFAQALGAVLPFLLARRAPGRRLRNALAVWLPAAMTFYGIVMTRSRGAVVALLVVVFLSLRQRVGRIGGIVVAVVFALGLVALGFTGGREIGMDESAAGRTAAWSEGLQMLKSSPVWGVGFGFFGDYHERPAHNSFVHCAAETGLVGYFLWLALIVLTLADMGDLTRHAGDDGIPLQLAGSARALEISLAAFLAGAFFLSRSYSLMLFLLLGLGTALADVGRRELGAPPHRRAWLWAPGILVIEVLSIVGIWVLVRILH